MHLAIAGNIGSGKTTLTTLLAKHYRYTPHFEQVDDNPYLNDFYKDMTRWSFNLQVYFLKSRFSQLIEMKKKGKPIILSHHMLYGLKAGQAKMSKSDPDSAIFMEDSTADVRRKIRGAYCPRTADAAVREAWALRRDSERARSSFLADYEAKTATLLDALKVAEAQLDEQRMRVAEYLGIRIGAEHRALAAAAAVWRAMPAPRTRDHHKENLREMRQKQQALVPASGVR